MEPYPPPHGVKTGLRLLFASAALWPLSFLVEAVQSSLIASVENTRVDELPLLAFDTVLVLLAAAGLARIAFALLTEDGARSVPLVEDVREALGLQRRALPPSRPAPLDVEGPHETAFVRSGSGRRERS